MSTLPKKNNQDKILFGNPVATQIYRECVEAFFAYKPWEVTATENTLTICHAYRYKLDRRCYLGYEYQVFDFKKKVWVKQTKTELKSSLRRIKYFYYGKYTTFRNICSNIAEAFFHIYTQPYIKNISSRDLNTAEQLFKSYCRCLYKNHSFKSREITDWFKRTSKKDVETEVKIGFKVGYYKASDLEGLRLDTLLPENSFNRDKALSFLEANPDFIALYANLKPKHHDQKITPTLLSEGLELNLHTDIGVQLRVNKKQFNKFKNVGTAALNNYVSTLSNRLTICAENSRYRKFHESHLIRHIENKSVEIFLYIYGLHVELGFKQPHTRFMSRFFSRVMAYIFRGSIKDWESSKHNIKTIYHAFHKLMYGNLNAKQRNKYIGKSREYNDLNRDMDVIFDYIDQDATIQLDKRASISGIKTKVQECIDEKNRVKMEAQKKGLEATNWLPRILKAPLVLDNCVFNEITNWYDLYLEGRTMNHCVYHNYNNAVRDGEVIVIHIRHTQDEGEGSTLGLTRVQNGGYEVLQNYGRNNSAPSKNIIKAVKKFLQTINKLESFAA